MNTSLFQHIFNNWVNGNRKDARETFEKLTSSESYSFGIWVKTLYDEAKRENPEGADLYFEMIRFFLFA